MPTTRVLKSQKPPVKRQGRKQRLDKRENPINGIPWANWRDFLSIADPVISAITPSTLAVSAPETLLTITGTNFGPGSVVEINQAGVATTFVNLTTLTIKYDTLAAGTLQFTVRNTNNEESNNFPFVVTAGVVEDPAPTNSSSKPEIIAWLVAHGVFVDSDAAGHFTKPELLAIVAAYVNDDTDALEDLLEP